jgi:L-Ala-D/L-Glu epimerase / N-acetyl-D-glutamate racemase
MRVQSIEIRHVALPLRMKIKHASHERTVSNNLVVAVRLTDGSEGFGEGVPRSYVTGETIETGFDMLQSLDLAKSFDRPASYSDVWARLARWTLPSIERDPRGMFGNAARCAVELAILDAYGRAFGESISSVLDRRNPAGAPERFSVRYSGAITAEDPRKERIAAIKMRVYGFRQVKVKVGVPGQDDTRRMRLFRRILGPRVDIRMDANEAWPASSLAERIAPLLPYRPSLIEQPVRHEEVEALTDLRPHLGLPVMLDESLCGEPDGRRAIEFGLADLFNVRLSKCGGLGPSLRLVEMAKVAGLGVQLGCHPGESGLLSAAGRHMASVTGGIRYLEGSFDRHVLAANIIKEDITFGYGGRASAIQGPGLGVTIERDALDRSTVRRVEVRYD